jgi:hypothetical protein
MTARRAAFENGSIQVARIQVEEDDESVVRRERHLAVCGNPDVFGAIIQPRIANYARQFKINDSTFHYGPIIEAVVYSEEHSEDLATRVLLPRLFMIEDATGSRQDDVPELARREQLRLPLFEITKCDVKARADGHALVQPTHEIQDDLAAAMVIDHFEFADISARLHDFEELNDHLTARAHENLALAAALCVGDRFESISQDGGSNHRKDQTAVRIEKSVHNTLNIGRFTSPPGAIGAENLLTFGMAAVSKANP